MRYCLVGLSRDLHFEMSDSRMEIIGPNTSRILFPIQTCQLFKRYCRITWVLEPSCPGLRMDLPFTTLMSFNYLGSLNSSRSSVSFSYIKVICNDQQGSSQVQLKSQTQKTAIDSTFGITLLRGLSDVLQNRSSYNIPPSSFQVQGAKIHMKQELLWHKNPPSHSKKSCNKFIGIAFHIRTWQQQESEKPQNNYFLISIYQSSFPSLGAINQPGIISTISNAIQHYS